ncbi:MAG: protein translocase subunit SecF, partial [Gemmataceae bacterium]
LPATLKPEPVSNYTIGSTLGADTIRAGTLSVGVAFLAVIVFMILYYRFAGLVASIALLANLLLTVAFMAAVDATFTLPGLAGLVLMLGMAVDANVLIYERFREERDRGASLALAIRNGYDRAFPTIIDTHLSSIFTAIVLYAVGNDQLKGFGVSLTVGLIISLFTALFMTRLIFDVWMTLGWLKELQMMRLLSKPNIDFMRVRNYWFAATVTVTVLGGALFIYRLGAPAEGASAARPTILNIDFTGGTSYTGLLEDKEDITTLRDRFSEAAQKDKLVVEKVEVSQGEDADERDDTFLIYYKGAESPRQIRVPKPPEGMAAPTSEEIKARASQLPDLSVEQIFLPDPAFSEGNASRLFKIRTSERAAELVEAAINQLLGDKLAKNELRTFDIAAPEKESEVKSATLEFGNPNTGQPAFVSTGQVANLLGREFQSRGLTAAANQFTLRGEGADKDGRYWRMRLELKRPVERAELTTVLEGTKQEFEARPVPEELANFDSELARETRARALYAILASWGAMLLYLWFRFGNWTFGLAAVLCLVHDVFFTLGIIAFCHYISVYAPALANVLLLQDFKLDLGAVAAILTLVGFSVNDTIVVFDRIREVRGKNPELTSQMINDSVNQCLSRTLLTSFIAFLVVIVLYIWGGDGVHLFSFTMVVGVIVGTYSSIYVASPLLLMLGEGAPEPGRRERAAPATTEGATA